MIVETEEDPEPDILNLNRFDVNVDSIPGGVLTRSDLIDIATKDKEEDDEEFPSENRE